MLGEDADEDASSNGNDGTGARTVSEVTAAMLTIACCSITSVAAGDT